MGRGPKPAKGKAKPAVPRKLQKNEDSKVRDLEKRLAEALEREAEALKREAEAQEQQAATSEILRVISSSPADYQPVFNTIVRSAGVVCGAVDALLWTVDGDELVVRAHHGPLPGTIGGASSRQPILGSVAGCAVREARIVHVEDLTEADDFPVGRDIARRIGWRTTLSAPLLRQGVAIGAILIRRSEVRPFTEKQITLLQTFADQAVIAIENVRLFKELEARNRDLTTTLARQTATSEVLRVISQSPVDLQPVFDAIAENAQRLLRGRGVLVVRFDGERLHVAALRGGPGSSEEEIRARLPTPASRETFTGTVVADRAVRQIADIETDDRWRSLREHARRQGWRANLGVPMLRDGEPIGAITVVRGEPGAFSEEEVDLLETFADQAVIAIENVRLFNETKEALERQTATSEILRVISRSPTDLQPVLDALIENAARLCEAPRGVILRRDGDSYHGVAFYNASPEAVDYIRSHPVTPGRHTITARVALERRTIHVADLQTDAEYGYTLRDIDPVHTELGVPMFRGDEILGVIILYKFEVQPFTDKQIALIETFAAQAVIAIENVRLFNETNEALEQQTATSEILRVISSSPTDTQPVFDAIAESAARLCSANEAQVLRVEGDILRLVAACGATSMPSVRQLTRGHLVGRAVIDRQTIHVRDLAQALAEYPETTAARYGIQSALAVPLMREGVALGVIRISRTEIRPFTDKQIALLQTFADQAVIAIDNVRLFTELQGKNQALTAAHAQVSESLDQQTATSEILRVISRSPTDLQPVFDSIAASALRLCDAKLCTAFRFDGELIHLVGSRHVSEEGADAYRDAYPSRPGRQGGTHRAILTRTIVHIPDIREDAEYELRALARANDYGCVLSVPMLRDGQPVGAITVGREAARPFTKAQIELLKTFADQAVIAIENVRLFTELQEKNQALTQAHAQVTESLEQQTATAEILRVISESQTDLRPVFEAIVQSAAQLCEATFAVLHRVDRQLITFEAHHGMTEPEAEGSRQRFPLPIDRETAVGRAILDRRITHIQDIRHDSEYRASAWQMSFRTVLAVPLLREGVPVGAIGLWRREVQPFSQKQIELVETFADQAVIAIENVRLFSELQQKNEALTKAHAQVIESLDQQTATSEILRVMSRSQTDVQPVFDTIVQSAVRLCAGLFGALFQFDGELLHMVAHHNYTPEALEAAHRVYPARPSRDHGSVRAIVERAVVNIPDVELDPEHQHRELRRAIGQRSGLFVPMLREGDPIGVIMVARPEPGPFSNNEIDLLKTFADQAVIAIENVRLFKELEARTQDLTRSVDELTALGEVGRAVSSTLDLETVLSTIVSRAIQLSGTDGGSVYEYDEATEEFSLRASRDLPAAYVEQVRDTRPRKGEGAVGRVAQTREPVQIADISDPAAYESRVRNTLLQIGLRALLAVPLIAEDRLVGALIVMRKRTGTFAAEEVTLLQTFATQSALAIQNARLFREIEDKSRQLEVTSQHKSEFLANMSHELRTPLNAIIGFSEVLSDRMFGDLNEKQEEYLKDIYASGTHLLSLINDILDLSKIEAGRMELELSEFHLPSALDNALVLIRERAGRRSIALHTDIDGRLGQIQADERKVRQVVLNLLSNAIKFTPEGGRIEVGAVPKDRFVEVSVSDTGIGIALEDQEKVFEEFRQVGTAAKKIEGTGLGLTLCRKFVELHGGKIWVKSQVGVGSTFTFTIPMDRRE